LKSIKFALPAILALPGLVHAQFSVAGRQVQVHGFASQGFAVSDENNFLTMNTSSGSAAMTDGGANVSVKLTDKFRVGAQVYVSNIGEMGQWRPQLDWAVGDYHFSDWFGVRAGRVKTSLGLYNDTQDMEFLHTWALLPQSLYPVDLRYSTIAHNGGDVYGGVSLRKAGSVSYVAYGGWSSDDKKSGYFYNAADVGRDLKYLDRGMYGADVRWNTPAPGLMVGASWMKQRINLSGIQATPIGAVPFDSTTGPHRVAAYYADYTAGKLHVAGEYRRMVQFLNTTSAFGRTHDNFSQTGWFASAAYRVHKRIEIGTYYSRFTIDQLQGPPIPGADHIRDQAVTARFDIKRFWHVKVEGHFMDGYGDIYSAHGFYLRSNPEGLQPKTNMLIIRTGFNL
jgi:hypothetical protein